MDNSFLANLTTKPIPKTKHEYKVKLHKVNPILHVVTSGIIDDANPFIQKDINVDNQSIREELLLKFKKKRPIQNISSAPKYKIVPIQETYKIKPVKKNKRLALLPLLELSITKVSTKQQPTIEKKTEDKSIQDIGLSSMRPIQSSVLPIKMTIPDTLIKINDIAIKDRMPISDLPKSIPLSEYYMNNRENFFTFVNSKILNKYKKELKEAEQNATCDYDEDKPFSPMAHQKIVRDYISLYSPYRGLLLFHGLGSGKTCTSIGIAEALKTDKPIVVMTPASLRTNYVEELKKCGDTLYLKNQYWEFINTQDNPEMNNILSAALAIPTQYIKDNGGAWLVNVKKTTNYDTLDAISKRNLDQQLNVMIRNKYQFIHYNGIRKTHMLEYTHNNTINPFNDKVVIIDEAHNFISRIVNKINKNVKSSIFGDLYEYLKSADKCKIILLTGTPIINYPNEIAVLFNILRGYIKTWVFKLTIENKSKINLAFFKKMFKPTVLSGINMDFIDYNPTSTTLTLTRNPFGFINKSKRDDTQYNGVKIGEHGNITDDDFEANIRKSLGRNKIAVANLTVYNHTALPDNLDDFKNTFITRDNIVKNMGLFKRRIMGLTSYFRSAQETLMPAFTKAKNLHVIRLPMSEFQFKIYEEARVAERKIETQNAKKKKRNVGKDGEIFDDAVSTYRIFSRAYCNFVFPTEHKRPMPAKTHNIEDAILNVNENVIDAISVEQNIDENTILEIEEVEDNNEESTDNIPDKYYTLIQKSLLFLQDNKHKFLLPEQLLIYSPKFLAILNNILDTNHVGSHLIYSQFRTLEGIGILKIILQANGFSQFKIKENGKGNWLLDMTEEELTKPSFALHTGTETFEEKEIIRNVFNGSWKYIPPLLAEQLKKISPNNVYGEIIKIFMITSSGAEGISLKNVRYVHIIEPYWHPVRMNQVIGRARRICSHQDLPEKLRTVDVYLYLMTLSEQQKNSDDSIELRLKDRSKLDDKTPFTSDETIFEIANLKENIVNQLLTSVKEASMDCSVHNKEKLKCLTFNNPNTDAFSYTPSIQDQETDHVAQINTIEQTWTGKTVTIDGTEYIYKSIDKNNAELYDLEQYNLSNNLELIAKVFRDKGQSQINYV